MTQRGRLHLGPPEEEAQAQPSIPAMGGALPFVPAPAVALVYSLGHSEAPKSTQINLQGQREGEAACAEGGRARWREAGRAAGHPGLGAFQRALGLGWRVGALSYPHFWQVLMFFVFLILPVSPLFCLGTEVEFKHWPSEGAGVLSEPFDVPEVGWLCRK